MKLSFYLFFLVLSVFVFGQTKYEMKKVDSLLDVSAELAYQDQLVAAIKTARQALALAKQKRYSKGIAEGNIYIAYPLLYLNMYNESLKYAKIGEKYIPENDYTLKADIKNIVASIYVEMKLYDKAKEEFLEKIKLSHQITDKADRLEYLNISYLQLGSLYDKKKDIDSSLYYHRLCIAGYEQQSKIDKDFNHYSFSSAHLSLAILFLKQKKVDSAEAHIHSAAQILEKCQHSNKEYLWYASGKLAYEKKEYEKALLFINEAIQYDKKRNPSGDIRDLYQLLAEVYAAMNRPEKEKEYLNKYIKLNDSLDRENAKIMDFVIHDILDEKDDEQRKQTNKVCLLVSISILIILLCIYLAYKVVLNDKKARETELMEKEQRLLEKEQEAKEMQKKINNCFEEVVSLAKENHPEFFIRFQEVYPEFVSRLLLTSPGLKTTELKFCAFLFLNFSTKDIAEFTFTSPRTVQTRKYNIRKKLNIPARTDIYLWIQNMGNSEQ